MPFSESQGSSSVFAVYLNLKKARLASRNILFQIYRVVSALTSRRFSLRVISGSPGDLTKLSIKQDLRAQLCNLFSFFTDTPFSQPTRNKTCFTIVIPLLRAVASWLVRSSLDRAVRVRALAWGHCVVFLGKTLNSHGASLHPGV